MQHHQKIKSEKEGEGGREKKLAPRRAFLLTAMRQYCTFS